jgi:hypothetical protein
MASYLGKPPVRVTVIGEDTIISSSILDNSITSSDILNSTLTGDNLANNIVLTTTGNISTTGDLTVDTNTLYVNSTNNRVGIGDASPQDSLEINNTASGVIGGLTISNDHHARAALSFARSSTATARIYISEPAASHTSKINFQTSNASGGSPNLLTAMVIDETQRVGIGTTSPSQALTIGGGNDAKIQFKDGGVQSLYFGDGASDFAGYIHYAHTTNQLRLNTTGTTTLMGGNVGIGTTSPSQALTIGGDANSVLISSNDYDLIKLGPRATSGANLDRSIFQMYSGGVEINWIQLVIII